MWNYLSTLRLQLVQIQLEWTENEFPRVKVFTLYLFFWFYVGIIFSVPNFGKGKWSHIVDACAWISKLRDLLSCCWSLQPPRSSKLRDELHTDEQVKWSKCAPRLALMSPLYTQLWALQLMLLLTAMSPHATMWCRWTKVLESVYKCSWNRLREFVSV